MEFLILRKEYLKEEKMKRNTIKLSNEFGISIPVSLEPEGNILEIKPNEFIEMICDSTAEPLIEIDLKGDQGGLYLQIWPGRNVKYKIKKNGEFI